MRRVLVAVDESDVSKRVARFVNKFFDGLDVEILAVNVARSTVAWVPAATGFGWVYPWPLEAEELEELNEEAIRHAEETVAQSGVLENESIVEFGDPAHPICQAADERDVDLVVVGSHHKSVFERLLSPSGVAGGPARD